MAVAYNGNEDQILERYQGYAGIDTDVTPPFPMFGMAYWNGSAWVKQGQIASEASTDFSYGETNVAIAGTAVILYAAETTESVTIRANTENTGTIYVGDSSVDSANGFPLEPGDGITLPVDHNSKNIYIDASVNNQKVRYFSVKS